MHKARRFFIFRKANWKIIKSDLTKLTSLIKDQYNKNASISDLWDCFKSKIVSTLNQNIPSKTFKNRHSLPWINRPLKRMIRKKCRLHRQAKKTKNWKNYRAYQKDCKRAFRRAEWDYTNKVIEEGLGNKNTKPFWKYIKSRKEENIGVSPLKSQGQLHSDSASKADILLKQFSSVFTKPENASMPPRSKRVNDDCPPIRVTVDGVEKLLRNIKVSKATGPDNIPNRMLQECSKELAPSLQMIFQLSLDTGTLPPDWTNANVSPIFKKGDRHLAENYRPVSLTSVTSKLLEHIVCHHMLDHLDRNSVLTNRNHGFRAGFSCDTQLVTTVDDLARNFDNKIQTDVVILDFSKAFDTVPHRRLLHKLENYGIRGALNTWVESFLCKRHMKVVVDGESSGEAYVESGVPQGTVLGPLLFLCHINDLPECVTSEVRLFADDCLLYRRIRSIKDQLILQQDLKHLEIWAQKWGMRFNAKKCYVLSIKNSLEYMYELDNTILKSVPRNPYLGLMISEDLKWNAHINIICGKASSTLGFLRRNLRHCSRSCRKNAYLSLVRSTLEYGAIVWDPFLQGDIDRVERVQRRAARFICQDYRSRTPGSISSMLKDLDLQTLQARRKELRLTFLYKVVDGLVPAMPASNFVEAKTIRKRRIRATRYSDYECNNAIQKFETNNSRCLNLIQCRTPIYQNSFFPRTVIDWNHLEDSVVSAATVEAFRKTMRI